MILEKPRASIASMDQLRLSHIYLSISAHRRQDRGRSLPRTAPPPLRSCGEREPRLKGGRGGEAADLGEFQVRGKKPGDETDFLRLGSVGSKKGGEGGPSDDQ